MWDDAGGRGAPLHVNAGLRERGDMLARETRGEGAWVRANDRYGSLFDHLQLLAEHSLRQTEVPTWSGRRS